MKRAGAIILAVVALTGCRSAIPAPQAEEIPKISGDLTKEEREFIRGAHRDLEEMKQLRRQAEISRNRAEN